MHSPANATNARPVITLIPAFLFVLRTRRSEVRIHSDARFKPNEINTSSDSQNFKRLKGNIELRLLVDDVDSHINTFHEIIHEEA